MVVAFGIHALNLILLYEINFVHKMSVTI